MMLNFRFFNYRSFLDDSNLSMEAKANSEYKESLITFKSSKYIPSAAIFGKNGGGKSNVIRALWLGVQFIRNSQRTQHEKAPVPVQPFALNDYSHKNPTGFEYLYVVDNIKYLYGFAATKTEIVREYLYAWPNGQSARIFERNYQNFHFPKNNEQKMKELIAGAVSSNQLFLSVACTMNYKPCIDAMKWFREYVIFSNSYTDIPNQIIENAENPHVLKAIVDYAKEADVGIEDMKFEFINDIIDNRSVLPENIPEELKAALEKFMDALNGPSNTLESQMKVGQLKASSMHKGVNSDGEIKVFNLRLSDESDGTRRLMSLAPDIEQALAMGGLLVVDEISRELHPLLAQFVISKFQNPKTNPNSAQLIFTTHDTELLNMELLRKDQVYFVDKDNSTGVSEIYSLTEYSPRTNDNIRKKYLKGKYGAVPDIEILEVDI